MRKGEHRYQMSELRQRSRSLRLTLCVMAIAISVAWGQRDSTRVTVERIVLTDGSEVVGTVMREDSVAVRFMTTAKAEMTIPRTSIKQRRLMEGTVENGTFLRRDPNGTRLFFAPTARPVGDGHAYLSVYELFFPMIAVGAGDHLTLAGGISIIPGANGQLVYLAPKVTPIVRDNLSLSAGLLYITTTSGDLGIGVMYGVGTVGNERTSFSIGLGWGFDKDETSSRPVAMVAGEFRLANSAKFITENWIPPSNGDVISFFGIRLIGDNLSGDLALMHVWQPGQTGFPFMPWVGFAYSFGK